MGILDFFRRKKKTPPSSPVDGALFGNVTSYDVAADQGTIELEDGRLLQFDRAACGGQAPERFQNVLIDPARIAGTSVTGVELVADGALWEHEQGLWKQEKERNAPRPLPQIRIPEEPRNPALEQAILENPLDVEAHLVLGDWLQDQGHPRGELISLMHRVEQDPTGDLRLLQEQVSSLLLDHRPALLGSLFANQEPTVRVTDGRVSVVDPTDNVRLGWRLGFIESARVAETWDRSAAGAQITLDALLSHPSGRRLEDLTLGLFSEDGDPTDCYHPALELMAQSGPRPTLRKLFIGDYVHPDEMEVSWTGIGDLGRIWPLYPNLEQVILQAGEMTLGEIDLPRLRSFELRTGGLTRDSIHSICAARWPQLERLVVWFGDENYGAEGTLADVEPLLSGESIPGVTHLGLMNCEFTDEICQTLVESPLAAQLELLDLSMGTMGDEGARALVEGRDALGRLTRLNVEMNYLSDGGVQALQELGWEVVADNQEIDDDGHRYVTVGE